MKKKFSIIIPVYNVESYLTKCIDSILAQTFLDYELILINDGSKDSSGFICDEYAMKDDRIRVFHKKNGGVSSARNLGLENAKGEWISFIDSDDVVSATHFENINLSILENPDAELYMHAFTYMSNDGKIGNCKMYEKGYYSVKEAFYKNDLISNGHPWSSIFKLDILRDLKLIFNENFSIGEDLLFKLDYLKSVNKIYYIDINDYFYRFSPSSLTSKKYAIEKEMALADAIQKSLGFLLKKEERTVDVNNYLLIFIFRIFSSIYSGMYNFDKKERIETLKNIRKNHIEQIKLSTNIPKLILDIFAYITKTRPVKKYLIIYRLASLLVRFNFLKSFDLLFLRLK